MCVSGSLCVTELYSVVKKTVLVSRVAGDLCVCKSRGLSAYLILSMKKRRKLIG